MRVVTWNIRKSNLNSEVWKILKELNPDIILLQEVVNISTEIKSSFKYEFRKAINKKGNDQTFGTAVLVKGEIISRFPLSSELEWVNKEIEFFNGNLVACTVQVANKEPINVISVYS